MAYSVGQIARLAGVSVRTLHHYDDIGLLRAKKRSAKGYRMYTDADVERLQRILFYRELEVPLDQIGMLVRDRSTDSLAHLRRQRAALERRVKRLQSVIEAVDKEMEAQQMGINLTPEERLEVFGDFKPEDYAEEAEQRWGNTDAYKQSQRRTSTYTKADWEQIKSESAAVTDGLVALMSDGVPATDARAMDLAEEHRSQITRWFYDCSYEVHTGLAQMYLADERFTANYEDIHVGLAQYIHDAIMANAERAEA